MKKLNSGIKRILLIFTVMLSALSLLNAVEIANDDFSPALDGWSGSGVSRVVSGSNGFMRIDRDRTASKTYNFGSTYANATVTIAFRAWVPNPWENSDDFNVLINGSVADTYHSGGGYIEQTITSVTDASGRITLGFNPDTTDNNEPAYIDWVTIDSVPPPPPNICTGVHGLTGNYYNNKTLTPPIVLTRVDPTINFAWGNGSPGSGVNSNNFSTEWTGTIYFPESANYIFSLAYDDEVELIIDGNTIYTDTTWTGGANNYNDAPSRYFDAGTYPITLRFVERYGGAYMKLAWRNDLSINSMTIVPTIDLCAPNPISPPTLSGIPDSNAQNGVPYTTPIDPYATGGSLVYSATGLPPGLNINATSGVITGTPTSIGTYTVTVTVTNAYGSASDDFVITVSNAPINATNNIYSTVLNSAVYGNVMTDDTGSGVDTGDAIYVSANTNPSNGTVTVSANGDFVYTPDADYSGSDTFRYTLTDGSQTDTATVTISVAAINTAGNRNNFHLVNTPNSRNIIGNYKIAGNTVLCLTERTEGYGGTCHGMGDYQNVTSNNQVVKYIDIDSDVSTWNSSSSFINVDNSYDATQGVVWAGLFWGGRISTDKDHSIRYYTQNAGAPTAVNVGNGTAVTSVNTAAAGGNSIRLSINNSAYNEILASEFHRQPDNVDGETYEAYADVTSIVSAGITGAGKYTFRVANLTTMEGREDSPGAFGGWSLVVIYAEDYQLSGSKARNISIYNGFLSIGTNDQPIAISGFKLPNTGLVNANISMFSGEGEYLYGYKSGSNSEDWFKISDVNGSSPTAATWDPMPGLPTDRSVGNSRNMYDAVMQGISRDPILGQFNNLSTNNVGVEVDNFDISTLMTGYRNTNSNINQAFIQTYSDNDYITVNMIAFSAELYIPQLCYDYTLDIDGHVLESVDNNIETPFGGYGLPLTTTIYLRSLDGDIDLGNVNVNYSIDDTSQLQYTDTNCSTEIAEGGEFDYSDACPYTYNETPSGFGMYIGTGKTTVSGGTIAANESRYMRWNADFQQSDINTGFNFSVSYTVDYGSGAVPLVQDFDSSDLCPAAPTGYLPSLGLFNVVDPSNGYDYYNLYTQVSRRPFDLSVVAHGEDFISLYPSAADLNFTVEVEMIRADNFVRDADTACSDEGSYLPDVPRKSPHFGGDAQVPISYSADDLNLSYRSVALRIWYLGDVDENGTEIILNDHNCSREGQIGQDACEELYARHYHQYNKCDSQCAAGAPFTTISSCYTCLRTNYGRKVCSRDNFAIRPESFSIAILDSNESEIIDDPSNLLPTDDSTRPANAIAGYKYRFDVNATDHLDDMPVDRYIQYFEPGSLEHRADMAWNNTPVYPPSGFNSANCNDPDDKNITISLFNGTDINYVARTSYVDKVSQVGQYIFDIYDQNWTAVDWDTNSMLHHTGSLSSHFRSGDDCEYNINEVLRVATPVSGPSSILNGCRITSANHINRDTGKAYTSHYTRYYPYTFRDGLTVSVGATGSNLLFINSPGANDQNMSYNISGTFGAEGKDGNLTNNFVTGCYAEDVNMSLYHYYNHDIPPANKSPFLSYDLMDFNTTNPSIIIRPREQNTSDVANDTTDVPLEDASTIVQGAEYFATDMNGTITMDLGYNFNREMNNTLNPRKITMVDFNLTFTTNPSGIMVDLERDYQIVKQKELDQNVTFVYGRAKSSKPLYDDVTDNDIDTPISVVVYCDLGLIECATRDVDLINYRQSNEFDWFTPVNFNNVVSIDGSIDLNSISTPTNGATVHDTAFGGAVDQYTGVDITVDGTNNGVNVADGGVTDRPLDVNITYGANTSNWLIFNPDDNSVPTLLYRVRFLSPGGSDWAGFGDTGHVVDDGASYQKNQRLGW